MATKYVCTKCDGENIKRDAWTIWNPLSGQWELDDLHDNLYCVDCENVNAKEVAI